MVLQQKLYTVEEFEAFIARPENRDRHFELINGEIVEKPLNTQLHGIIAATVGFHLFVFLEQKKPGRGGFEVLHRVMGDDYNARQPDICVNFDIDRPIVTRGAVPHMPDIAIEIEVPDDTYQSLREKAKFYIANGTKLVYLVFPEKRFVEVYEPNKDVVILDEKDTLEGGELLPGFSLPIADIFKV